MQAVIAGLIAIILLQVAAARVAVAAQIWNEQGLGRIAVGSEPGSSDFIVRKFYAVVYGPDSFTGSYETARRCTGEVLKAVTGRLRSELIDLSGSIAEPNPDSTAKEITAAVEQVYTRLDETIGRAADVLHQDLAKCAGPNASLDHFSLGVIQRICSPTAKNCQNAKPAFANSPSAQSFSLMLEWIQSRMQDNNAFPANRLLVIVRDKPSKADEARLAKFVESTREANRWPPAPSADEVQAQFENGVRLIRSRKQKFEYTTPRSIDLPQQVALGVIDTLDAPRKSIMRLMSNPKAKLREVSDEVARTRFRECKNYRGFSKAAEIAKCAGYTTDASGIEACLRGDKCVPTLSGSGMGTVLAQVEALAVEDLASKADLPRIHLGRFDTLIKTYQQCAKGPNVTEEDAQTCLMRKVPSTQKAYDCFFSKKEKSNRTKKDPNAALECAAGSNGLAELKEYKECQGTGQALGACMARRRLPSRVAKLLECKDRHPRDAQAAALCAVEGMAKGDAVKVTKCLSQQSDWAGSAGCMVQGSGSKDLQAAAGCLQTSGSDSGKLAGCMAAKKLPEKLRKPVQCASESGGDPVGTGACMASDSLTPEQRIALQCAVNSGGEPTTFAACTAGQLTLKELTQCADKKFGEGNCFGKNNEFRKLARNLLGTDIGPSSEVAKLINIKLEAMKITVAVAQAVGKGVEQFANNVGDEAKRIERKVDKAVERAGRDVARATEGVVKKLTPKVSVSKVKRALRRIRF